VSLPERRYDVAGEVLAAAIERSIRDGVPVATAVSEAAAAAGRRIAGESSGESSAGPRATTGASPSEGASLRDEPGLERVAAVLARYGYEPRTSAAEICLANCPFDRLAAEHTELVCGMNLALIDAVIDGLGVPAISAELAPEPGLCCVKVSSRTA
jgi:hypothetical protein